MNFSLLVCIALVFLLAAAAAADDYVPAGFAVAPEDALDIARVTAPAYRDPIFDGAADPSVVYAEKEKAWYVFYTQRRANVITRGVDWCYNTKIGIAKSIDQGRNWEYQGVCLGLERGKQAETFWAPHVFLHDGTFHMILTYIPRGGGNGKWSGKAQLAHYTSADGETWKDLGLIDVKSDNIIDPAVVLLKDGRWLLVFRDDNAGVKTAMCVSTDLKTWTRLETVVGDQTHEGPVILHFKEKFWMICDDWRGLGVYVSDDGLKYERNGRILDVPGKRLDDADIGRHAGVARVGDKAFVFYFTHPGRTAKDAVEKTSPETTTAEFNRSSIQIAELDVVEGNLVARRDAYAQ